MHRRPPSPPRAGERGFTLIELMVGLTVGSLLIGMVLAISFRMSTTYRAQGQIVEVQQTLAAAINQVRQDAKLAGYAVPNGFRMPGGNYQAPVQFINGGGAVQPDQIRLFWGDPTRQARVVPVTGMNAGGVVVNVDSAAAFSTGDLVVVTNVKLNNAPSEPAVVGEPPVATYEACVGQITTKSATWISLAVSGTFGANPFTQCDKVAAAHAAEGLASDTMVYGFVARAYRIDPTRPDLGVLQASPSGGLSATADWQDIAVGFSDFQVGATYDYSWTSTPVPAKVALTSFTAVPSQAAWPLSPILPARFGPFPQPTDAYITFVARTLRKVDGVATGSVPAFGPPLGDQTTAKPVLTDANGPMYIYRYATARVDFRNLAVSR